MEYDIKTFATTFQEWFIKSPLFPLYKDEIWVDGVFVAKKQLDSSKHPNRSPQHLQEAVERCFSITTIQIGDYQVIFDLGSEEMERTHPYYHILQQAPVIRKANRGTSKTKGSQAKITDKGARDYEQVSFGGKFGGKLFKEYSKNVRGERNRINQVTHWKNGQLENGSSNSYQNRHYKYIDKITDSLIKPLATTFGLKPMGKKDSGLTEELAMQWDTDEATIIDIMNSFE